MIERTREHWKRIYPFAQTPNVFAKLGKPITFFCTKILNRPQLALWRFATHRVIVLYNNTISASPKSHVSRAQRRVFKFHARLIIHRKFNYQKNRSLITPAGRSVECVKAPRRSPCQRSEKSMEFWSHLLQICHRYVINLSHLNPRRLQKVEEARRIALPFTRSYRNFVV